MRSRSAWTRSQAPPPQPDRKGSAMRRADGVAMRIQLLVSTASVIAGLVFAGGASAATLHSSPAATRTAAPCTAEQPCKLGAALGLAFDADEVVLAPGAYDHSGSDPLE